MSRSSAFLLAVFACSFGFSTTAHANPVVRLAQSQEHRAQLTLSSGFDEAIGPLSLAGTWFAPAGPRTLYVSAEFTVPMARPDLGDHRLDLFVEAPVMESPWDVWFGVGVREVSTANDAYRGTAFGSLVTAAAGYFDDRFTVAAESSTWFAWVSCVSTTSYASGIGGATGYRGCSTRTALTPRVGARLGVTLGDVELSLRGGYEWRGEYNLAIPPVYVRLGIGYRF